MVWFGKYKMSNNADILTLSISINDIEERYERNIQILEKVYGKDSGEIKEYIDSYNKMFEVLVDAQKSIAMNN
jgi:hypothetical protein